MEMSLYAKDLRDHKKNVKEWKVCRSKIFHLMLQHCPSNLKETLNALSG